MQLFRYTRRFQWGRLFLSAFWISGLLLGCYLAMLLPKESISFVRQISIQQQSIIGLFFSLNIPLLLSFFAFKLRLQFLILPIAFVKAVCFSFCALCLVFTFGDAGWLLYRFYIFSDSCAVIVLLWFWIRYFREDPVNLDKCFYFCLAAISAIWIVDYVLVSPFAMMLFHY